MDKETVATYVWKKRKVNGTDQEVVRMVDMSETELAAAYKHCKNMLYNDSKLDPGRFIILQEITTQLQNCNAELAIRWFLQKTYDNGNPVYSRFSLLNELNEQLEKNKVNIPDDYIVRLEDFYSGLPVDYQRIPVDNILRGCKDLLGKFNRKHITKAFIIKQGIWFTREEIEGFKEVEKAENINEILTLVKGRLGIGKDIFVPIKSTGLSYEQFRSMINLKVNKKYSELTTCQLETLKNKILFVLEEDVNRHIEQWQVLMKQLEEVAELKQIKFK